jgi:hypothetical protein
MPRILLGLSLWNVLFLAAVLIAAWAGAVPRPTHMLVGLFVVSFALLAHSLVFLHFLGTGASIKKAVAEHGLDIEYARRTRTYKLKTFPLALTAMLWTVAAGGVGGGIAVNAGEAWAILHRVLGPTALLVNIAAHWNELRWVGENSAMIEEIDGILATKAGAVKTTPA